jgi:GT2 family glycosyltransferase
MPHEPPVPEPLDRAADGRGGASGPFEETEYSGKPESSHSADAAIVIVNYRAADLVERCVESVMRSRGELTLELAIVDSDSGDGSVERLRASLPAANVIAMPSNRGFAAGVNAGMAATAAPLVVVLNPDTELSPGSLGELLGVLRSRPRVAVAAPLLQHADGALQVNGYRRFPGLALLSLELCVPLGYALAHAPGLHPYAMAPAALQRGDAPAHVAGAAMAIRRAAYEQAGPLDEGFFLYLEETEWQARLVRRGWEIALAPRARASHLVRSGGEAALAPSPHFLASALRYLSMQGVGAVRARLCLSCALALSWLTLLAIALLPSKRGHARLQAAAYGRLLVQALGRRPAPGAGGE